MYHDQTGEVGGVRGIFDQENMVCPFHPLGVICAHRFQYIEWIICFNVLYYCRFITRRAVAHFSLTGDHALNLISFTNPY
jgi:hypothetical protein